MKVGDLVKRRGQEWYAIVIGFRTEIVFPSLGKTEKLEAGHTGYPILVWVDLDGSLINRDAVVQLDVIGNDGAVRLRRHRQRVVLHHADAQPAVS